MPAYHYKALTPDGKVTKGVMQGDSSRQVRHNLRGDALMPIEVLAVEGKIAQTKGRRNGRHKGLSAYGWHW